MYAEFNLYVPRDSWLHRLDPRAKLLFILVTGFFLFAWPTVWMAAALVCVCLAAFWAARIPRLRIQSIWQMMWPFMLLVLVLTALFGGLPGATWLRLGPVTVTDSDVQLGAMLALRLLALALVIFLLMLTTDQATLVRGLLALHVPYEWGLTLALALRYLPIFAGLFRQVREAQQARGLDLERGGILRRLRAYQPVLVAMVISALRQSEHLGWALEARAQGAQGVRRTVFRPLHLRRPDVVALGALGVILLAGVGLRIL